MTVFNTFWKVINKYKGTIILFTVMLIAFGGINTTSNNSTFIFINYFPKCIKYCHIFLSLNLDKI